MEALTDKCYINSEFKATIFNLKYDRGIKNGTIFRL
jgi:hypothetical protein